MKNCKTMKKILYTISAAAFVIFAGCNEKIIESCGDGALSVDLSCDGTDYIVKTKAGETVNTDNFVITINRPADGWNKVYGRFADMPKTIELGSGQYTISAATPSSMPAAWNQPIYGGTKEFTVAAGQTTPVRLTCYLANMKVTLNPTANFLNELTEFTVVVSNGEGNLTWEKKNVDVAGYFTVAPLHVHVDGLRALDGSKASYDGDIVEVAARDHHVINLDAKVTGAVGGITIDVDCTTNDKNQNVNVPGFEEIPVDGPDRPDEPDPVVPEEPVDAPSISWPGNEDLAPMDIVDGMQVELLISAPKKIKSFVIKLKSDAKTFMSLVSEMTSNPYTEETVPEYVTIDLINDPVAVAAMAGVGIAAGENLVGKEEVPFSLSSLVPLIPSAGQAGPDTYHTFALEIGDEAGNEKSWELVFHVPAN